MRKVKNMQDAISEIVAKNLSGSTLTEQERKALDEWLLVPANADEYAEFVHIWNAAGKVRYQMKVDVDAEWNLFRKQVQKTRYIRPRHVWAASIAASVALLIGIFASRSATTTEVFRYATVDGAEMVVLPDSSTVWLNKNSQLTYKYNEARHSRNVALCGEAMFNVRHTGDDFVVKTPQNVFTKVLGTSFNLKAYDTDGKVELTVVEGKVSFGARKNNRIVTKGQHASFDCAEKELMPTDSLDNNALAWRTGLFAYDNKSLSQISVQLGDYLNKKIVLPKDTRNIQYTGKFDHPTAESVAEIIATAMNWNYQISDSEIVFSKRK